MSADVQGSYLSPGVLAENKDRIIASLPAGNRERANVAYGLLFDQLSMLEKLAESHCGVSAAQAQRVYWYSVCVNHLVDLATFWSCALGACELNLHPRPS